MKVAKDDRKAAQGLCLAMPQKNDGTKKKALSAEAIEKRKARYRRRYQRNKEKFRLLQRLRYRRDLEKQRVLNRLKQRVFKAKHPEVQRERVRTEEPAKRTARNRLRSAVRRGIVVKPACCQGCNRKKQPRALQGHHPDYAKPYEVEWLCAGCHGQRHQTIGSNQT